MPKPGFEPGLPRPQRGVLSAELFGLNPPNKIERPHQESNLEAPKGAALQAAARPLCDTGLKI